MFNTGTGVVDSVTMFFVQDASGEVSLVMTIDAPRPADPDAPAATGGNLDLKMVSPDLVGYSLRFDRRDSPGEPQCVQVSFFVCARVDSYCGIRCANV